MWCRDRAKALHRYGKINDWDVSQVTNMASLFRSTRFNDPIDRWDVRHVMSMKKMFYDATEFNQSLDVWDVCTVVDMSYMFKNAKPFFNQPLASWNVGSVVVIHRQ